MANANPRRYRFFVLGAGFSRYAGLPLGRELFQEVLRRVRQTELYHNFVEPDLKRFFRYKRETADEHIDEANVDYEEFVSFLDVEHFLGLKGSDTWSRYGNKTQVIIKNYIAQVLHEHLSSISPDALAPYLDFVRRLGPFDHIITYNYDTLLEQCLDMAGIRYRLFPDRYVAVHPGGGIVDSDTEEVIILKMHGSMDWFDLTLLEEQQAYMTRVGSNYCTARHPIFSNTQVFAPRKIVEGPYPEDSPLNKVYRIRNLGVYFSAPADMVSQAPLILSPSYHKLFYVNPLKEFWYGFNRAGSFNRSFAIIGFSLPDHDEYIRQGLYVAARNFQRYDPGLLGFTKNRLKMVDFRGTLEEAATLKLRYRFIDWSQADLHLTGFGPEAVPFLFNDEDK